MKKKPPFLKHIKEHWVIDTLSKMTLDEKIGQLFQVAAFSNRGDDHEQQISKLIEDYHLGGLTFFQGNAKSQVLLTNHYQSISKYPLFINIDAEWGLGMRLSGCTTFPYQMALGAIQNNTLIYEMGKQIAKDAKRIGVCSPLAPVVDVNNNPKNPVINYRSFGENKELVAEKGIAFMKGLQSENILDNAKHFPGHGDTSVDSHLSLPILEHTNERLQALELYPFKELIKEGLSSIMSAHLSIPAWDDDENVPATLSQKILKDILVDELAFEGLVITDALDMQGITNYFKEGEADVNAILAGNHIITNSQSVPLGVKKIKDAIQNKRFSEKQLNSIVAKLLAMKKWVGLDQVQPISLTNLDRDLHSERSLELNFKLAAASITQLGKTAFTSIKHKKNVIFLQIISDKKTISNRDKIAHHLKEINIDKEDFISDEYIKYIPNFHKWRSSEGNEQLDEIIEKLNQEDEIIISLQGVNIKPFNHFDIPEEIRENLFSKLKAKKITLLLFGNAYALDEIQNIAKLDHIFIAYQDGVFQQKATLECLLGEKTMGKLPVSLNNYKQGKGL